MFRVLLTALWTLPVILAARMLLVWNDLPDEMASHFGTSGDPDSFLPRWAILGIAVAATTFGAANTTFTRKGGFSPAISAGVTVLLFVAFWQVIDYGLGRGDISIVYAAIPALIVAGIFAATSRTTGTTGTTGTR